MASLIREPEKSHNMPSPIESPEKTHSLPSPKQEPEKSRSLPSQKQETGKSRIPPCPKQKPDKSSSLPSPIRQTDKSRSLHMASLKQVPDKSRSTPSPNQEPEGSRSMSSKKQEPERSRHKNEPTKAPLQGVHRSKIPVPSRLRLQRYSQQSQHDSSARVGGEGRSLIYNGNRQGPIVQTDRPIQLMFNVHNCSQMNIGPTIIQEASSAGHRNDMTDMPAILKQYQDDFSHLFVPTGGFLACKDTLFKHRALVITGASGTGKTMIAQQLQLKLWEEKQCHPFRQDEPSSFSDIFKCKTTPLRAVHIDDVFGSSTFLKEKQAAWLVEFDDMAAELRAKNTYIIFTTRDYIWDAHIANLTKYDAFSHVVNLSEETFALTEQNMRDILDNHARKANLTLGSAEMMNPCHSAHGSVQANTCPIGYPQSARLLCAMKNIPSDTRIRRSMEFLRTTIASYREDDHVTYCVLIMLLINDGRLPIHKMPTSKNLSDEIKWCMRVTKVEESKSKLLLDAANSLTASLLLIDDACFVYQHQSIMEAVTLDFGKNFPSEILDRCSVQFLVERVFTRGSAPKDNDHIVKLQSEMFQQLCTRLVKEISSCLTGQNKAMDYKRNHKSDADSLRVLSSYSVIQDADFNHVFLRHLRQTNSFYLLFTSATSCSNHPTFMFLTAASGQDAFVQEVFSSYQHDVQQIPHITEHLNAILYAACYSGSLGAVRSLLASGAQVDYNTAYDPKAVENSEWYCRSGTCSTMMHASYSDNAEVLRLICDHLQQQSGDATEHLDRTDDRFNYAALHWWATGGRGVTALPLFLGRQVNINVKNKRGITALHIAAINKDQSTMSALLDAGANINAQNSDGQTALHISVASGDEATVRILLVAGTNLNVISKYGTALHNCATMGNVSITRMLLEAVADVKLTSKDGETALHACARKVYEAFVHERFETKSSSSKIDNYRPIAMNSIHHQEILRLLLETVNDDELVAMYEIEALRSCALDGYESVIQLLNTGDDDDIIQIKELTTCYMDLKYHRISKAAVKMINIDGKPALHKCAERGNITLIQAMLEAGADVNMRDGSTSALHIAAERGHVTIVRELVKKGADLNLQNVMMKTPLHLSAQGRHETVVILLLASGANLNKRDNCGQTTLHLCAGEGNEVMVQILLGAGAKVNQTDNSGQTALHLSAKSGRDEVVMLLLSSGAEVNMMKCHATALHFATENDNAFIVQALLEKGASVKMKNTSGETPLHIAARNGYVSISRLLLDAEVDECTDENRPTRYAASVDTRNSIGETALILSTSNGHEETVKLLLACGADVNMTKYIRNSLDKNVTVLHIAAEKGNLSLVQTLLDNGADMKTRNIDGENALHLCTKKLYQFLVQEALNVTSNVNNAAHHASTALPANVSSSHEQVLRMMLQNVDDIALKNMYAPLVVRACALEGYEAAIEPFRDTGGEFNADNIKKLADLYMAAKYSHVSGADVNNMTKPQVSYEDARMPALHYCAVYGYVSIARVLLDAGFDVNVKDMQEKTALTFSAENNNESLVALLLKSGADVNIQDKIGRTALHESASRGFESVVHVLLDARADINMMDENTGSALHMSAGNGHAAVVHMLLTAGADVNMMNKYTRSALHMSAGNGHAEVVHMLLKTGADVNLTTDSMESALHESVLSYCSGACREAVVKVLIAAGAKLNVISRNGTVLHICARAGHVSITQMLLAAGADANGRNKDGNTALHITAETGYALNAEALLKKGADFQMKNIDGVTALHLCARKVYTSTVQDLIEARSKDFRSNMSNCRSTDQHEAVLRALLEAETDTGLKDGYALAGLRSCALQGYEVIVQPVLDKYIYSRMQVQWTVLYMDISYRRLSGIDVNMLKYGNMPVLHVSVINCDVAMVQLLLEAGSDANLINDKGESALLYPVGCDTIVQALLRAGADVNMADMNGRTALHNCTRMSRYLPIARLLVAAGVDVNKIDDDGHAALHYAIRGGELPIVRLLVEAGADVNLRASSTPFKNKTPLDIAVICSRYDISDYLRNLPDT